MTLLPLNGTKTHPLTAHGYAALERLRVEGAQPSNAFNAGVANRLLREELVREVELPSPYATHRGRPIPHLIITAVGRAVLATKSR